uniref:Protein zer-1 homolog-like C-terminal domain-containing protein n=1 Tax=Glossina brevipalpis TaxID=37001 RepID=A0A1A9X1C1_9MUSC
MDQPEVKQSSLKDGENAQGITPDLDDSISFTDDADVDIEVDVDAVPTKKPHFLDYDAVPPPELVEHFKSALNLSNCTKSSLDNCPPSISKQFKIDKKYESDGEISDYELAANGYTKKEFTQDDNTLQLNAAKEKPLKHFLDENPIPPDYMLSDQQVREHRSLDRNFERHNEQRSALTGQRSSRDRLKDVPIMRLPKGAAWTQSFDSRYFGGSGVDKLDILGPKVECVYSLLWMLGSNDRLEMAKKFHELSRTPETCNTLPRSRCIPLLVQMIHAEGGPEEVRKWAGMALHNVVHSNPDEKAGRREAKVLRLLDQIMDYCSFLRTLLQSGGETIADDADRHPLAAISSLMKVSFDEEHRHAMCELGALHGIPSLVHLDQAAHGPKPENQCCNSLRRFALMALTNLTFGDENNKALLCSQKMFMEALVAQLDSAPDDLLQVTASVLRNLSWRADTQMKAVLNEIGTVTALAKAAMKNKCENTLKAILSALWNLSAHCSTNKAEFCAVNGALSFIVKMLTYEGPSKTLKIIENAGGILRNVSSHIAVREDYRQTLRDHNCLAILLQQLKSESLTVVSNSCGTLWNLSARCPEDQRFLWDNGAVPMLRSLIHSKHAMISEGSACALKNLLNFRPSAQNTNQLDAIARSLNLKKLPTLNVRKQKALEQELGVASKSHAETCDNLDTSNTKDRPTYDATAAVSSAMQRHRYPLTTAFSIIQPTGRLTRSAMLSKSESRDSVFSAKSDTAVYEQLIRSHSASDANRKIHHISRPAVAAFVLKREIEPAEEQPIDYSVKYNENINKQTDDEHEESTNATPNQETDLDQPTDFSLRYAENHVESDLELSPVEIERANHIVITTPKKQQKHENSSGNGNEILLILEDSVKCYQTEDTPYVISNAASITDLRSVDASNKLDENDVTRCTANTEVAAATVVQPFRKYPKAHHLSTTSTNVYSSGSYTPEKPVNYCEEGTPGYFSRYESLSSLDETSPQLEGSQTTKKDRCNPIRSYAINTKPTLKEGNEEEKPLTPPELQIVEHPRINSALETPLMFSRRSSLDSLAEDDVDPIDDKSSVVSEFSRLASGVISPSEIPDSPTQSMPQSPRHNAGSVLGSTACFSIGVSPMAQRAQTNRHHIGDGSKRCLRGVFEDETNTFHVENTPAQFSTATSLSNLSILDEESAQQIQNNHPTTNDVISEGEEGEDKNDNLLLASCINMGMNRATAACSYSEHTNAPSTNQDIPHEEPKQYCTEDTPALLSKVGSNTNLSSISTYSSPHEPKEDPGYGILRRPIAALTGLQLPPTRRSLNLSDDMSSNASESSAAVNNFDILQQCIRDGMKKPSVKDLSDKKQCGNIVGPEVERLDPIAMLRRGGNALTSYLPVNDEINKYGVEDSPCNFSMASGLSNLTVGSSLVGSAVKLKHANNITNKKTEYNTMTSGDKEILMEQNNRNQPLAIVEDSRREWQNDSLSSLSIESEDDSNLLSQAIAAGCKRPKSNLGFCTNSARRNYGSMQAGNESFSSVDSSDSNDNQSKSLLELCILTGMHKKRDSNATTTSGPDRSNSRKNSRSAALHRQKSGTATNDSVTTKSNPNLKQSDSLSIQGKLLAPNRHLREQERRDEKLLMECITTGIMKKIEDSHKQTSLTREALLLLNAQPKNGQATSAAAQMEEASHLTSTNYIITNTSITTITPAITTTIMAAPDVGKNNFINNIPHRNWNLDNLEDVIGVQKNSPPESPTALLDGDYPNHENIREIMNGFGSKTSAREGDLDNCDSISGIDTHQSDESNQSFIMESTISLDVKFPDSNSATNNASDKHKDPDLMLKSVERLTMEFVSSAEQRTSNVILNGENCAAINTQTYSLSKGNGSNSNNTWNEDTCPNDISFPSVSVTAPKVASLSYDNGNDTEDLDCDYDEDQATTADFKELNDFGENISNEDTAIADISVNLLDIEQQNTELYIGVTQPNSLDAFTETESTLKVESEPKEYNETVLQSLSAGINFKVGGKVQTAAATGGFFFSGDPMTNSTFIAQEARKLAANFQICASEDNEMTFSINSLDLDNIRPPSGMDSINMSGYYHDASLNNVYYTANQVNSLQKQSFTPHSPQLYNKSPKFPRKSLPSGLIARRALGHLPPHLSGSAESILSSCNLMLDNIKPPSLMDELLDSMISVASIQSELAEDCHSVATTVTASNYETAAAGDDNTITLQSCCDNMPFDDLTITESNSTSLPSECNEYSSSESTPRKSSTISGTGVRRNLTPKQKRKLTKDRFKTYTVAADRVMSEELKLRIAEAQQDETLTVEIADKNISTATNAADYDTLETDDHATPRGRRRSGQDRYKTQTIVYTSVTNNIETNAFNELTGNLEGDSLPTIFSNEFRSESIINMPSRIENDLNSLECDQNSETESTHDLNNSNSSDDGDDDDTSEIPRPRVVKPDVDKNFTVVAFEKEKHETSMKALRGGKRVQYISPYSKQYQRINNGNNLGTKSGQNDNISTKHKSTYLSGANVSNYTMRKRLDQFKRNNSSLAQKRKSTSVAIEKDKENPQSSLQRQNTFVKEEPSIDKAVVPVVEETSPTRQYTSKLPTKRQSLSANSANNSPQKAAATRKLLNPISNRRLPASSEGPQRANSNVNIRVTTNAARIAVLSSRISASTPPSRSNSTINSVTAATAAQNAAAKINQVQSRIASIRHKIEEPKNRQQNKFSRNSTQNFKTSTSVTAKLTNNTALNNTPSIHSKINAKPTTTNVTRIAVAQRQQTTIGSRK